MRLFKIVLTALIAAIALLTALLIGAMALITNSVLSFFRRRRPQTHDGRTVSPFRREQAGPMKGRDLDVIDVTATEVPLDRGSHSPLPSGVEESPSPPTS